MFLLIELICTAKPIFLQLQFTTVFGNLEVSASLILKISHGYFCTCKTIFQKQFIEQMCVFEPVTTKVSLTESGYFGTFYCRNLLVTIMCKQKSPSFVRIQRYLWHPEMDGRGLMVVEKPFLIMVADGQSGCNKKWFAWYQTNQGWIYDNLRQWRNVILLAKASGLHLHSLRQRPCPLETNPWDCHSAPCTQVEGHKLLAVTFLNHLKPSLSIINRYYPLQWSQFGGVPPPTSSTRNPSCAAATRCIQGSRTSNQFQPAPATQR